MKANRIKLELAMARACLNTRAVADKAQITLASVKNVLSGRSVKPATLGRVCQALGVDVADVIENSR